jgi:hypothetical protein
LLITQNYVSYCLVIDRVYKDAISKRKEGISGIELAIHIKKVANRERKDANKGKEKFAYIDNTRYLCIRI